MNQMSSLEQDDRDALGWSTMPRTNCRVAQIVTHDEFAIESKLIERA